MISTRDSMNTLYKPDQTATLELKGELDRLEIKYIEQYEFRLCRAEHTSESNPAYWDIYFEIGEREFAIRNFNIRLFTREKAHAIRTYLLEKGLNCSVVTHADGKTLGNIKNTQNKKKSTKDRENKASNNNITAVKQIAKALDRSIDLPKGFGINCLTDNRLNPSGKISKKESIEVLENQIDMFGLLYS